MIRTASLALALLATPALAATALAGPADDFLAGIDGKWRGGGTLSVGNAGKQTKVRCSLRNAMQGVELALIGRCASSAGTRPLRGKLVAQGSAIAASSLKLPGAGRLSGPSARLSGNSLTITGSLRDGGKTVPVRNTLTRSGSQLTLNVSAQQNGAWQDRGTLTFRR